MKIKNHIISFIVAVVMLMSLFPTAIIAQSTTTIAVEKVTDVKGGEISVPIRISDNTGICGATISINYNKALTLKTIEKGAALSEMTMTKPGDITANPIRLVWDAMDPCSDNGIIAVLTFTVPNVVGKYDITISYGEGDIVDGNLSTVNAVVENGYIEITEQQPTEHATISIDNVTAAAGETVDVPIRITDNPGICGATLKFTYNNALTLTGVSAGSALTTLTMTKPGNLSSNPFNLMWDGLEPDSSEGIIAALKFTAPDAEGEYAITASYENGDIIDGDLNPIGAEIVQGKITVVPAKTATVLFSDKSIKLTNKTETDGKIIVALYSGDILLSISQHEYSANPINISNIGDATLAKVMWWDSLSGMKPLSDYKTVNLNE